MVSSAFTLASDGRDVSAGMMLGLVCMEFSIGAPATFGQRQDEPAVPLDRPCGVETVGYINWLEIVAIGH